MRSFRSTPRGVVVALVVFSLAFTSCGGKKPKPLYPTSGKLLINGQPVGNVTVFLTVENPADAEETRSFATTELDGTFKLTTRALNDGAPAGDYVVTLIYEPLDSPLMRQKGKPPSFDKKYSDPKTSPLRAKITAQPQNTLDPFDVK